MFLSEDIEKLQLAGGLASELRTIAGTGRNGIALLNLDNEIEELCTLLEESAVPLIGWYNLAWDSPPNCRIPLKRWLIYSKGSESGKALTQTWLRIPTKFRRFEIWSDGELTYWNAIIETLAWWWAASQVRPIAVEWTADLHVTLIIRGSGYHIDVREIDIEDAPQGFWAIEVKPEIAQMPQESLTAALLVAQLAAQQGNGALNLRMLGDGQIEIQLKLPRADAGQAPPENWPLPQHVTKQVTDYTLELLLAGVKDVCQRVELALSEELSQVESVKEAGGEVDQLGLNTLRKAVSRLSEMLRGLDDWIENFMAL